MQPPARILISGGTGLIGTPLIKALRKTGAEIFCLTRNPLREAPARTCFVGWNGIDEPQNLPDQIDLVVNLAGENVAGKRWTKKQRAIIEESRVIGTSALINALSKLKSKPSRFISASAVGIYGDRGEEILSESSAIGKGFLANTAHNWEKAARKAEHWGASVTLLRFGVVLSPSGGALKRMLLPFRLGLGATLGAGQQYMSWTSLNDAIAAILFSIENELTGPINVCTPEPLTNEDFTRQLAASLNRPAYFKVPGFLLKLLLGDMAQDLLLSSTRVLPEKLLRAGFEFSDSLIADSIAHHSVS